jgi:hypothetical protein
MSNPISPKQLAANRRNAAKSTGPKTAAGKAASRRNALKHGVLAQSVVVRGHQIQESAPQFKQLCQELYASLAPVGPLEKMLVDQIATASWRLRRTRHAESGEVALSVDTGWWQRENHSPVEMLLMLPPGLTPEPLASRLQRSVDGCRYLAGCYRRARRAVEQAGELTEAIVNDFAQALRGEAGGLGESLQWQLAQRAANPDHLEPEALRVRQREQALQSLDRDLEDLEFAQAENAKREDAEERARQAAALLPSDAKLDKLLRYETAAERQWYRAMHELERLQRQRQGEAVPALVAMDLSARG